MRKLTFAATLALVLAGCGAGVDGVYTSKNGAYGETIELKDGKMLIGTGDGRLSADYKVDGDQVTISEGGRSITLKHEGNCLKGGDLIGDYCKQ